jgi:hypothetical protein
MDLDLDLGRGWACGCGWGLWPGLRLGQVLMSWATLTGVDVAELVELAVFTDPEVRPLDKRAHIVRLDLIKWNTGFKDERWSTDERLKRR